MPSKVQIPDFQQIVKYLDFNKIAEAISTDPKTGAPIVYRQSDLDNIKDMIWTAAEKWLPRDLVEFQIDTIEQKIECEIAGYKIKAYQDVDGTLNGKLKPYDEYKAARFVLDWKTSAGELDTRWKNRLVDSWQWKLYTYMSGAKVFNYRGVSRRCEAEACLTRDVILEVPTTNKEEVEEFVRGALTQRSALIHDQLQVWPRNMPDACNKYNRLCPFKDDCDMYTMPRYAGDGNKVMSYSYITEFMLCPEKARRSEREEAGIDESEETSIGHGFHAGIAELYRQAKEIKL